MHLDLNGMEALGPTKTWEELSGDLFQISDAQLTKIATILADTLMHQEGRRSDSSEPAPSGKLSPLSGRSSKDLTDAEKQKLSKVLFEYFQKDLEEGRRGFSGSLVFQKKYALSAAIHDGFLGDSLAKVGLSAKTLLFPNAYSLELSVNPSESRSNSSLTFNLIERRGCVELSHHAFTMAQLNAGWQPNNSPLVEVVPYNGTALPQKKNGCLLS